MNKYLAFVFIFLIVSCKSKAVLAEGSANGLLTSEKIIANHYNNKTNFSTVYIKANAKYKDEKNAQSVTAEIRIKKDEKILVSVRFLGFTVAKAFITPTSVQYYDKIGNNYFEGDYAGLSQWLGTDLDFNKVQNMFLGEPLDNLNNKKYAVSILDKLYKLENNDDNKTFKSYFFESENFLVKKQQVNQPSQERALQVLYSDFKKYDEMILPLSLAIEANQQKGKTTIDIEYKSATFNEELSFPYSVPEGYERIYINK
jgi:Domain of unknown function (DUF4292)